MTFQLFPVLLHSRDCLSSLLYALLYIATNFGDNDFLLEFDLRRSIHAMDRFIRYQSEKRASLVRRSVPSLTSILCTWTFLTTGSLTDISSRSLGGRGHSLSGSHRKFGPVIQRCCLEINVKKILAVINATYAVAKRKPEKIRLAVNNCEDLLYIYFFIPQFKYMYFIYS